MSVFWKRCWQKLKPPCSILATPGCSATTVVHVSRTEALVLFSRSACRPF